VQPVNTALYSARIRLNVSTKRLDAQNLIPAVCCKT